MSRDFDKAQEMVVASMEYVKVLGFRIRRTEVQRDDWKKVALFHADEVIKLRQHVDALKAERDAEREALGIQAAKEAGKALGMVEGEGLRAAAQRVVKERDALRTECDDLRNRGEAYRAAELETERERHRQTAAVPQSVDVPRTHPVPCDPPEATHITPDGKATAQAAVTPQPGDVVRLVRVPTVKDCSKYDFQDSEQLRLISTQVNTMGKVVGTELCEACACVVDDTGTMKAWPLSCVEVVKGGEQ